MSEQIGPPIPRRDATFSRNQYVTWGSGSGQVSEVSPFGILEVRGKDANGQRVIRHYDADGVLCGRYMTNQDLTLDAAGDVPQDDDLMDLL